MSKEIDEKVVSMQFDNANFEKNVAQSMKTTENLKKSLRFKGVEKGFDSISASAKKVNLDGINSAAQKVQAGFSSLEVIGVTALANLTNSAVNAGKRIAAALTIEPVHTGFQEYETQIGAVQTILANTQSKGSTLDDVNAALDELNTYADQTIYNFTEMTRNIGTFTAAGVDLEKAMTSIKGIANLAAVSGSTSQQASTAMYQLSQALAAGKIQLMDWNSVVNAGMGGEVFQTALKRTATQMGYNVDALIEKYGSFRESLTKGEWLTAEVLTETLTQLSGAYTKADLIAQGYTESQAEEIVKLAETAVSAATDVKTFTQLMDTTKEAVQSGWTQTWEILIGDFEEAKELFSGISGFIGDIINASATSRNNILESAFGSTGNLYDDIRGRVELCGISFDDFNDKLAELANESGTTKEEMDSIINAAGSLEDAFKNGALSSTLLTETFDKLGVSTDNWDVLEKKINDCGVTTEQFEEQIKEAAIASGISAAEFDEIIGKAGSLSNAFKQGLLPIQLIKDAIKNFADKLTSVAEPITTTVDNLEKFQDVVNRTIRGDFGNGEERINALTEAGYNNIAVQKLVDKVWEKNGKTWSDTTITSEDLAEVIDTLSEEEIQAIGYTEDQTKALKELAKQAEETGTPLNELIENLKPTGRELILDSLATAGKSLVRVFQSISGAWKEVFALDDSQLYNMVAAINKFVHSIEFTEDAASKLQRTFKGLFSLIHILTSTVGGGLKLAFKVINKLLEAFDTNLLDVAANIGDFLVKVDQFITDNELIAKGFEWLADGCKKAAGAIRDLFNAFLELPGISNIVDNIKNIDLTQVGRNIIQGLQNGLTSGLTSIPDLLANIGTALLNAIKEVLGIHSPSTEAQDVGENFIQGLINGLKSGIDKVAEIAGYIGSTLLNLVKDIDLNKVFSVLAAAGVFVLVKKFVDILSAITAPMAGLGNVFDATANLLDKAAPKIVKVIGSVSKVLNAFAFRMKLDAISGLVKSIGTSILMLAGSLFIVSKIDSDKLWGAVGAIGALVGVVGAVSIAMSKLSDVGNADSNPFGKLSLMLLSMSVALLLITKTVKGIGEMNPDQAMQGFMGLAGIAIVLGFVFGAYGRLVQGKAAQNIDKLGSMLLKLSIALGIMAGVIKLLGTMPIEELGLGAAAILGFVFVISLISDITGQKGINKNINKLGSMLIKMAVAIGLMVGVSKLVGLLSTEEMIKGGIAIGAFLGVIALLSLISKIGGKSIEGMGKMLLSMSVSMLLLLGVTKLIGLMSVEELAKGYAAIILFVGIITLLALITNVAGNTEKLASTILAFSVAIGILAGVAILLGLIDTKSLIKGVGAVVALGLVMAAMTASTKNSTKAVGNIIAMVVAIGVMALAVAGLSTIDSEKLGIATASLMSLMGMFALMETASKGMKKSTAAIVSMTVLVTLLGVIMYKLAELPVESVLGTAASLSMVFLSISAALFVISYIPVAGAIQGALGLSAFIGIMGVVLAALGALSKIPGVSDLVNSGGQLLADIGYAIGNFVGSIIGGFGAGITSGLPEMATNLSGFMTNLQPFLSGCQQLTPDMASNVASLAGAIMALTAADLLSAIASFITNGDSFAQLGSDLSAFYSTAQPFINGVSKLDPGVMSGVQSLATAILTLTAADVIEGLTSWLTGGASLTSFGEQLAPFGEALAAFGESVKDVDPETIGPAAEAAKMLAEMASIVPNEGGLLAKIVGDNTLGSFATNLESFGEGLSNFSGKVANGAVDKEAIADAVEAGKSLVGLAEIVPNEGGLLAMIVGDNTLSSFGANIEAFGEGLANFSEKVANGAVDKDAIANAIDAGESLVGLSELVPEQGGFLSMLIGDDSLGNFGKNIESFGTALATFSSTVSGKTDAITNGVNSAANLVILTNSLTELDTTGIDGFSKVTDISDALKTYSDDMKNYNSDNVSDSITALNRMVAAIKNIASVSSYDVSDFTAALTTLASIDLTNVTSSIIGSYDSFQSMGTMISSSIVSGITNNASSFSSASQALVSTLSSGITKGISSLSGDVSSSFNKLLSQITSSISDYSGKIQNGTATMMLGMVQGISSKSAAARNAITQVLGGVASQIRSYQSDFYSAGAFIISGLVSGISSGRSAVIRAASNVAAAALTAANNTLDIESPSKEFRKVGMYSDMGLINGFLSMIGDVEKTGGLVGKSALDGTRAAMSGISTAIESGINAEPTIRPVLDLSNLRNGLSSMNNLVPAGFTLNTNLDTRALDNVVTPRWSNNDYDLSDVVSAIDRLLDRIDNMPRGNTYNVNGINYDDGTNVSNAVSALIRAARIERRV